MENILLGCSVILIVYGLNDKNSYEKAIKFYKKIEEMKFAENLIKILIGNKTDLKDDERYGNFSLILFLYIFIDFKIYEKIL